MKKWIVLVMLLVNIIPVSAQTDDIHSGDTITDTLTSESEERRYNFVGNSGDAILITLKSSDFDPHLVLESFETGEALATNDDYQGSLNARIDYSVKGNNIRLVIVVSSKGGAGEYQLDFRSSSLTAIEYGDVVEESLSNNEKRKSFVFTAQQDELISISLESSDFNPYLEIYEKFVEYPMYSDDDSGVGTGALIGPFTVPDDTEYVIVATTYDTDVKNGDFTLKVNQHPLETIAKGDTVEGSISAENGLAVYSFEGTIGERVTLAVESSADLTMTLQSPTGYEAAYSDDDGAGKNPEISSRTLDASGTYLVIVRPFTNHESGDYTLTFNSEPPRLLEDTPQTVVLSEKHAFDYLTFMGEAGTTVHLMMDITPANNQTTYISVYQNDTLLAYADSYNYEDFSHIELAVEIDSDGPVRISLSDYSYAVTVIEVSLETVR